MTARPASLGAPRIEIDLDKITHNARLLVGRLAPKGISVTGVTKAALGAPEVAEAMRRGGVRAIGDSRVENIETMRASAVPGPMTLIRAPMPSQVDRVIEAVDLSFNTEAVVIEALSESAGRHDRSHEIVLMVELGDLREGVLPADVVDLVRHTQRCPHIVLAGLGTNLACRSGVVPDRHNMSELSRLVEMVEATCDLELRVVSGGNSANLEWALQTDDTGRINDLRLGESIVLGCEPLHRRPLEGLHTDAFVLVAEVIESKRKPVQPWGEIAQAAFGEQAPRVGTGEVAQSLLAIGRQDVDPDGLVAPLGCQILGASSDHLIIETGDTICPVGTEVRFAMNYAALVRAMTSPFVAKVFSRPYPAMRLA